MYLAFGEFEKGLSMSQRALNYAKRSKAGSLELSRCLCDAAWINGIIGNLSVAEQMYKESLEIKERIEGNDHPHVAYTLRNLGMVYTQQYRYQKASELMQRSLDIMLKYHDPDDQVIGPFLADMAKVMAAQGKFNQAEDTYKRAQILIKESYGPEHLYTAAFFVDLADFYVSQKRLEEAEALIQKTLKILHRTNTSDSFHIVNVRRIQAKICLARNKYDDAERLALQALNASKDYLLGRHPLSGEILSCIVEIKMAKGRHSEAEKTSKQTVSAFRDSLGRKHIRTVIAMQVLAKNLMQCGQHQKAYDICKEALSILEDTSQAMDSAIDNVRLTLNQLEYQIERTGTVSIYIDSDEPKEPSMIAKSITGINS